MANVTGASLAPIYNRLAGAPQYHPLEADTFADWSLEAGDIVTISRDGRSYQSPVHNSTLTWKKQHQMAVSSTGKEKRDSIAKMSQKKYKGGSSGLKSQSYWHQVVEDQYHMLQSGIELTASSASLWVRNAYTQMKAGLDLTASSAALYVENKYSQMKAGLDLTSSSAALYVENKYSQMKAGLDLTSSSAALYVENKYSQMKSGLDLTASSAALYVDNKYSQMKAGLDLTASSASLWVSNAYTQMKSGLDLTMSSAALYVDNKYSQMKAGLDVTMSSATLYAQNRTTRAAIVARINADGEGEALIDADKVQITGTTTINDVMVIESQQVKIKKSISCQGSIVLNTPGAFISAPDLQTTGHLRFGTTNAYDLTASIMSTMVVKAAVDNNTLKLWKYGDAEGSPSITFSKAASDTPTLSGTWSNGNLIVSSDPSAEEDYDITLVAESGKIRYYYGSDDEHKYDTGATYPTSGDTYTRYNFSKKRTQDQDGYHYTFSIGTGWTATFGNDGGTYYLYKKD